MINFVAGEPNVVDRLLVIAVERYPVGIRAQQVGVQGRVGFDVVDVEVAQAQMVRRAADEKSRRYGVALRGGVVADLKAPEREIALPFDAKSYCAIGIAESRPIEDRRFPRGVGEGDVAAIGRAGDAQGDFLVIDAAMHVRRIAGREHLRRVLERRPRCGCSAGIFVIAGHRYVTFVARRLLHGGRFLSHRASAAR